MTRIGRAFVTVAVVVVALGLGLATPSVAWAAPEDIPAARARFRSGVDAYDAGKYEEALRYFQEAHALSHNAALYFNMAACEEHMDHFQAAGLLLRQYLLEEPNAEDKENVNQRIAALEQRDERLHTPHDMDSKPTPAPVVVAPQPTPVPVPVVVTPEPPPETATKPHLKITYALIGVTAAFGAATLGTGIYTVVHHNNLHSGCGATAAGCSQSQIDGLHHAAQATDALIAVTAVAAIATIIVAVIETRHPAERRQASVRSFLAADFGVGGRF